MYKVELKGYELIRVFKVDTPEGDIEYWATNDLQMDELTRLKYTEWSWTIEEYHRGIKQCVGIERALRGRLALKGIISV